MADPVQMTFGEGDRANLAGNPASGIIDPNGLLTAAYSECASTHGFQIAGAGASLGEDAEAASVDDIGETANTDDQ